MSQRTVLIVSYYFPPHSSVGVQRPSQIAKYLPRFGWEPVVLTVQPDGYRTAGEISPNSRPPEGVPVYRTGIIRPAREITRLGKKLIIPRRKHNAIEPQPTQPGRNDEPKGLVRQFARLIDLAFATPDEEVGWFPFAVTMGLKLIRRYGVERIYTTSPPHSAHLTGHVLSRLAGLPWIADYQDPWTLDPWRQGTRSTLENWAHVRLEHGVLNQADRLIFNTENARQAYIVRFAGNLAEKSRAIPNGFDPDDMKHLITQPLQGRHSSKLTVLHAGSLYGKRDPFPMIRAVDQLHRSDVLSPGNFQLTFLGKADMETEARSEIHVLGLAEMIRFIPPVPREECLKRMREAEMLLILQPDTQLQIPAKLYEYVQLRKPILAITEPEGALASILRKHNTGILVLNQIDSIVQGLCRALDDFKTDWDSGHYEFPLELYEAPYLTQQIAKVFDEIHSR